MYIFSTSDKNILYISSPPNMKTSASSLHKASASSLECAISQPGKLKLLSLVNTIFLLFGNALPIDSKFFLPKIIECPVVIFLTYCQSFGILHGISLFLPITRFLSIATINETFIIYTTFSYRSEERRVGKEFK